MVEEGFDVTEEYELGARTDVKEDRTVLPTAKHVLLRVDKASTRLTRDESVRALNIQVRLVEGIEMAVVDEGKQPTGDTLRKYANKVEFLELEYQVVNADALKGFLARYAKGTEEPGKKYFGANRSFLVSITQFLEAVGYPKEQPVKINDEFLAELAGKQFYADVLKSPVNIQDENGHWQATGDYKNRWRNFVAA